VERDCTWCKQSLLNQFLGRQRQDWLPSRLKWQGKRRNCLSKKSGFASAQLIKEKVLDQLAFMHLSSAGSKVGCVLLGQVHLSS